MSTLPWKTKNRGDLSNARMLEIVDGGEDVVAVAGFVFDSYLQESETFDQHAEGLGTLYSHLEPGGMDVRLNFHRRGVEQLHLSAFLYLIREGL